MVKMPHKLWPTKYDIKCFLHLLVTSRWTIKQLFLWSIVHFRSFTFTFAIFTAPQKTIHITGQIEWCTITKTRNNEKIEEGDEKTKWKKKQTNCVVNKQASGRMDRWMWPCNHDNDVCYCCVLHNSTKNRITILIQHFTVSAYI